MQRIHVKMLRGSDTAKSVQSRIVTRYPCPNPDTKTASAQRDPSLTLPGLFVIRWIVTKKNAVAGFDFIIPGAAIPHCPSGTRRCSRTNCLKAFGPRLRLALGCCSLRYALLSGWMRGQRVTLRREALCVRR